MPLTVIPKPRPVTVCSAGCVVSGAMVTFSVVVAAPVSNNESPSAGSPPRTFNVNSLVAKTETSSVPPSKFRVTSADAAKSIKSIWPSAVVRLTTPTLETDTRSSPSLPFTNATEPSTNAVNVVTPAVFNSKSTVENPVRSRSRYKKSPVFVSWTVTLGLAASPAAWKFTTTVSLPLAVGKEPSVPRSVNVSTSLAKPSLSLTMRSRLLM